MVCVCAVEGGRGCRVSGIFEESRPGRLVEQISSCPPPGTKAKKPPRLILFEEVQQENLTVPAVEGCHGIPKCDPEAIIVPIRWS